MDPAAVMQVVESAQRLQQQATQWRYSWTPGWQMLAKWTLDRL